MSCRVAGNWSRILAASCEMPGLPVWRSTSSTVDWSRYRRASSRKRESVSSEKLERMKNVFEESLALYRKQKWDAAAKGFATLVKDYGDDTSKVFLGREAEFKEDPPGKDWDGVFHRTSK